MPQLKVQNLYNTTITEAGGIPASGDCDFTVAVAPENTNGFIIISPENPILREIMYYHNVSGSRIYVRKENRFSPKAHAATESVKMNDVAEIFNTFSDMISQAFYVEKTGGLTVRVWGGYVYYNGLPVSIPDTNLTLADDTTNYIKYDYPSNTFSVDTVNSGNIKAQVITIGGEITSIGYRTAKESYIDFTVALTGALPDQTGQDGKVLGTQSGNVSWVSQYRSPGIDKTIAVDRATGVEVIKDVTDGSSILSTDTIRIKKASGDYEDVSTELLKTLISEGLFMETMPVGTPVGTMHDGTYKIQATDVITSTASGAATFQSICNISDYKFLITYSITNNIFARVVTISESNVVTYGTAVAVGSVVTPNVKCAYLGSNNIVITYTSSASTTTQTYYSYIGTISGDSITLGTEFSESFSSGGNSVNAFVGSLFKVRDNAFGMICNRGVWGSTQVRVLLFSGTTISGSTQIANYIYGYGSSNVSGCYIADNLIGVSEGVSTNGQWVRRIYSINPASGAVVTTYQISSAETNANNNTPNICKYSDNSFIETNPGNTVKKLFTIPASGTTLVATTLTTNGGNGYIPIAISNRIYAIVGPSSIVIYQGDTIIGTINGTASIYSGTAGSTFYSRGRILGFSGATIIPTIVNLSRIFYSGVAVSAGVFSPRGLVLNITGGRKGSRAILGVGGISPDNIGDTVGIYASDTEIITI